VCLSSLAAQRSQARGAASWHGASATSAAVGSKAGLMCSSWREFLPLLWASRRTGGYRATRVKSRCVRSSAPAFPLEAPPPAEEPELTSRYTQFLNDRERAILIARLQADGDSGDDEPFTWQGVCASLPLHA